MTCNNNKYVTLITPCLPEEGAIASPYVVMYALPVITHNSAPFHLHDLRLHALIEKLASLRMFVASTVFTCGLASATMWSHSSCDRKL